MKFRGIMVGGVWDPCRLLIVFDPCLVDDEAIWYVISSVDMNGGGDKGRSRSVGVFGWRKCPTVSGSFILRRISGVTRM